MSRNPYQTPSSVRRHYFVDEAGDPAIFNRKGKVIPGQDGCSTFFIVGLLDVSDPERLSTEMAELRLELLRDPYFSGVPSMQPARRKTALAFHAKDDLPEVRREVFNLLIRHDIRFFALIRDKRRVASLVQQHNLLKPGYRYHPNQLYDRSISRLFKDRLHKDPAYRIIFAKRGSSDRTDAFRRSLEQARDNFRRKWGRAFHSPIEVVASSPEPEAGLQAVDYMLWALQRLYERGEDRYWNFVNSKVSLIQDVDDVGRHNYGEYYSQRRPLTSQGQRQVPLDWLG